MQQVIANEFGLETLRGARSLDISAVQSWLEELTGALNANSQTLSLDMAEVEKIDTACLQALTAFVLRAREQRIEVVWQATSSAFRAAAEDLGLNGVLGVEHE